MSFGVWFADDIVRLLGAMLAAGRDRTPEYRQALRDVAAGFGVDIGRMVRTTPIVRTVYGQADLDEDACCMEELWPRRMSSAAR